ncbi:MAG: hypothetical protein IJJ93_07035, partial [Acidaminococcaceae bacterium]|nr:hypothetical protein [Acidaminococcaceae bacterium]
MMAVNFYTKQAKKHYVPKIGSIGMVIFTVLWVVLSLFTFHCTGVEAAVPKPEEISGDYHYYAETGDKDSFIPNDSGTRRLILQGNTLYMVTEGASVPAAYNAQAGTARWTYRGDTGWSETISLRFSKGADGKVHASGTFTHISSKGERDVYSVNATKTRSIAGAPSAPAGKSQPKNPALKNQKKSDSAKSGTSQQKKTAKQSDNDTGNHDSSNNDGHSQQQDSEYDDRNDLPSSDAGKTAAAVGTGMGGAMLGGAAGAA